MILLNTQHEWCKIKTRAWHFRLFFLYFFLKIDMNAHYCITKLRLDKFLFILFPVWNKSNSTRNRCWSSPAQYRVDLAYRCSSKTWFDSWFSFFQYVKCSYPPRNVQAVGNELRLVWLRIFNLSCFGFVPLHCPCAPEIYSGSKMQVDKKMCTW